VPQTLLKAGEDGLLVAALEIDDAIGVQPGLRERRRKQIQSGETPEHLAARAGGDARGKEGGGRTVDRAVAAARDFMQCAKRQRAAWEPRVHRWDSEWECRKGAPVLALDLPDLGAQRLEGGRRPHGVS
jgi:hypothetical protein